MNTAIGMYKLVVVAYQTGDVMGARSYNKIDWM